MTASSSPPSDSRFTDVDGLRVRKPVLRPILRRYERPRDLAEKIAAFAAMHYTEGLAS